MNHCKKKNVSRHVSTTKRYERISKCWLSYENPPFQCSPTNNDASNGAFSGIWGNSLIWTSEQLGNPLERMEDVKPYPTFKLWAIRPNDPESLSFDQYLYCLDLHLLGRTHSPLIHITENSPNCSNSQTEYSEGGLNTVVLQKIGPSQGVSLSIFTDQKACDFLKFPQHHTNGSGFGQFGSLFLPRENRPGSGPSFSMVFFLMARNRSETILSPPI